jgi:cyclohexyl-isocyanide hydratase
VTLAFGVLLFDGVDELDVIGPARVFWALDDVRPYIAAFDDVEVHLISESGDPVTGAHGLPLAATTSYASCPPLDVLVATGGASEQGDSTGRRFQQRHPPTLEFLRGQSALVTSVCTGAFLLGAAGRLSGQRATTHWTARDEFHATFQDAALVAERLVDEGDVITSGGVTSGIDLGLHVVERLLGRAVRVAAELALEIDTPPNGEARPREIL